MAILASSSAYWEGFVDVISSALAKKRLIKIKKIF